MDRLSSRLDGIAIGPPGHQAVLHLAGRGEIAREPDADTEQHDDDHEADDRATAVVAGFGIIVVGIIVVGGAIVGWVGHHAVMSGGKRRAASSMTAEAASHPAH